ncbi:MAG: hypothetical protein M3220_06765 [Chloroflexota bacterium]|nr:hypothetical protein [Chloroflexota bacterium]
MKILFTTPCKPIPIFLGKYLSIDDVSYRFIVDQGLFNATADVPAFSLHYLAQNINVPSVVLEWPTFDELEKELRSDYYDYIGITFKFLDVYMVVEMIEHIRRVSPHTQIILGGYGTLTLDEPEYAYIQNSVDYVCKYGDGVAFLRHLIGDYELRPTVAHMPLETIYLPWLPAAALNIAYILSALGCVWKCEFCCTSAYAGGKVLDTMSPEEIVDSMRWYHTKYPHLSQIYMMDEELLLRQKKVRAIGKLIREDESLGLSTMSYLAFGTIKAISRWDPEEMLLNGVSQVWSGVESLYSYYRKKGDVDSRELMRTLNECGIETQLSWIIGDDCQTKENIQADIDYFIDHVPTTAQLSSLSAFPGTPLYSRLKAEGRVQTLVPEEAHLLGNNMDSLHFTHEERLELIMGTHHQLYEAHGPSLMRSAEVFLNGYEYCRQSKNPYLREDKARYFEKKIKTYVLFAAVAEAFAPNDHIRQEMRAMQDRYVSLFGPLNERQQFISNWIMAHAEKEMVRREREGYEPTPRDVPLKRYTYDGRTSMAKERYEVPLSVM